MNRKFEGRPREAGGGSIPPPGSPGPLPNPKSEIRNPKSLVIGLTGGVASGKSLVAACLEALGARRVDADAIVDELYARAEIREAVRAEFGAGVMNPDGSVDRRALGRVAFRGPADLKRLTAILHPHTRPRIRRAVEEARKAGGILVLDVPLLHESGLLDLCDRILFVGAPAAAREARGRARGWPEGEVARREKFQLAVEEKRRAAHAVVENSGSPEATRAEVGKIWKEWSGAE